MKSNIKISLALLAALLITACASTPPQTAEEPEKEPVPEQQKQPLNTKAFQDNNTIYFDFDKSNVRTDQQRTVLSQAQFLKANEDLTVMIAGYADPRGTKEYNLALGNRRANSTKDFLIQQGVETNRLKTISYGKEFSEGVGHTEAQYRLERKTVSTIEEK